MKEENKNIAEQPNDRSESEFGFDAIVMSRRKEYLKEYHLRNKDRRAEYQRKYRASKRKPMAPMSADEKAIIESIRKNKRKEYQHEWYVAVDKGETEHNAAFPLELPMRAIKIFTREGGLVYDPYMGSGTTALACKKLFRNYVGSEINPRYVNKVIEGRLSQAEMALMANEAI